jgi:hypothetical protein
MSSCSRPRVWIGSGGVVVVTLAGLLCLSNCASVDGFHCGVSSECVLSGQLGTCEPTGFCSFPDLTCASGRRYGSFGGPTSGICVGAEMIDGAALQSADDAGNRSPTDGPAQPAPDGADQPDAAPSDAAGDGRSADGPAAGDASATDSRPRSDSSATDSRPQSDSSATDSPVANDTAPVDTAPQRFTISGNAGVSGATVTAGSAASTTADGSGNYALTSLVAGSYVVTPSKSGCTFSPASQTVTLTTADVSGVDFTATCAYSISGHVGAAGATVAAGSQSATADANGAYTITGVPPGTYTVTPSLSICTFTPTSQSVTVVNADVTGVDFAAACSQWAASATASGAAGDRPASLAAGAPDCTVCFTGLSGGAGQWVAPAFGTYWLQTTYSTPVHATGVAVHEGNHSAGGIVRQIDYVEPGGTVHTQWTGTETTACMGFFTQSHAATSFLVSQVKVTTYAPDDGAGWAGIDAVRLDGAP